MKILHTADWHLDSPMTGLGEENARMLRQKMLKLPEKIVNLCLAENCDMLLIAGDLFDGPYTKQTMTVLYSALCKLHIPVIIAPGNHDFCSPDSPYEKEQWPENVHIFTKSKITSLPFPELDCIIYGAGYEGMDCPGLLKDFHADGQAQWQIGILHGDAGNPASPYCPVSRGQLQNSGLQYLAMGHVHKLGSLRAGNCICAWPGCPMGRGFDELGPKGVILVDFSQEIKASFVPLDGPCFYDEDVEAGQDPAVSLAAMLPAMDSSDFYRVTLTGYSSPLDLEALRAQFPHIPHLWLQDATVPEVDLWSSINDDTLEGVYFSLLKQAAESGSEVLSDRANLAARISRKILDGQEVKLP